MFTGVIGLSGRVARLDPVPGGARVSVTPNAPIEVLVIGESIAINGACLTVEPDSTPASLRFFLSSETLARTALGDARPGLRVNLERALRPSDRLGGHLVLGHVDAVGQIRALERVGEGWRLDVDYPAALSMFMAEKGSIAVDGISLTLARVEPEFFSVAVIPLTVEMTTLADARPGQRVNLEADVLARYAVRGLQALSGVKTEPGLTLDKLLAAGFGSWNT